MVCGCMWWDAVRVDVRADIGVIVVSGVGGVGEYSSADDGVDIIRVRVTGWAVGCGSWDCVVIIADVAVICGVVVAMIARLSLLIVLVLLMSLCVLVLVLRLLMLAL